MSAGSLLLEPRQIELPVVFVVHGHHVLLAGMAPGAQFAVLVEPRNLIPASTANAAGSLKGSVSDAARALCG